MLGDSFDAAGDRDGAEAAWRGALIGWERLMIEHLRRKNIAEAAESTVEVGKLLYVLGRRGEALQRFDDAIEADDDRDQSYIDIVAFLVQAGETDAALSVYHRALARPGRAVSEYVKVYTSLWILDLTRRTNKVADPKAEAYLRTLDQRHGELRQHRGAAWSRLLARYAVGRITYDQALAAADTAGKRAEIYFYEAMRRLERRQVGRRPPALAEGHRHADVLVLRVRHGVPLPAPRRPLVAARHEHRQRRSDLNRDARPRSDRGYAGWSSQRRTSAAGSPPTAWKSSSMSSAGERPASA